MVTTSKAKSSRKKVKSKVGKAPSKAKTPAKGPMRKAKGVEVISTSQSKINEEKWTRELMKAGYTVFPSIVLEKQHTLGLTALDVNILLNLSTYWWESGSKPRPAKKTIASAIGVHPRTVQRRIAIMEGLGYLKREFISDAEKGNKPNKYHFDGLIDQVKPFAVEKNKLKEEKIKGEAERRARKRALPIGE